MRVPNSRVEGGDVENPAWVTGFFVLGCVTAALHAYLLRGMTRRVIAGAAGAPTVILGFFGRLAIVGLVFVIAASSGRFPSLLACVLGFASTQALIILKAGRRRLNDDKP